MEEIIIKQWEISPSLEDLKKTISCLIQNNINVYQAENDSSVLKIISEILPKQAEVMDMTSMTLKSLQIPSYIHDSTNYNSVRNKLKELKESLSDADRIKLISTPQWAIGSVHAITKQGQILVASYTGSQLSSYVYGASKIIWVASTNKIVENLDEGFKRIYEHCLPLEEERVRKNTKNKEGSEVNKILILNKETIKNRIHLILTPLKIGF